MGLEEKPEWGWGVGGPVNQFAKIVCIKQHDKTSNFFLFF